MIGYSISVFIASAALFAVGLLMLLGKLEILRTYHYNADKSPAAFRKAVSVCLMFAALPIAACGALALFFDSVVVFLASFAALIIAVLPLAVVLLIYNR